MKHFIGKHVIDISISDSKEAFRYQQHLSNVFWKNLLPALDRIFSQLSTEHELWKIDKLQIDLGNISEKDLLSGRFIEQLIRQIEKEITSYQFEKPQLVEKNTIQFNEFGQWLFFLEYGCLPWQSAMPGTNWERTILDTLALESNAVEQLRHLISREKSALKRIILQYPVDFVATIVELFTGFSQKQLIPFLEEWKTIQAKFYKNKKTEIPFTKAQVEQHFLQTVLMKTIIEKKKISSKELCLDYLLQVNNKALIEFVLDQQIKLKKESPILAEIVLSPEFQDQQINAIEFKKQTKKNKGKDEPGKPGLKPESNVENKTNAQKENKQAENTSPLKRKNNNETNLPENKTRQAFPFEELDEVPVSNNESWYIYNSGIVLLHPFLSTFFKKMGLLKKGEFANEKQQQKAVQLLHFMATGESTFPEYQLTLLKVLCDYPIHQSIPLKQLFNKAEKEEAESLLEVMISHWEVLGNTSIDGLREGFMQREGKLSKNENGWLLQVEQHSIDMLLEQLPWNLGIIKLAWVEEMMRVEWR